MKATMHDLATELLESIFAFACTDGGYTGCSLSLVSKYIRATSRSTRFHSISLVSGTAQQLAKFLHSFDAECAAARAQDGGRTPLIRHLCIAAADGEDTPKSWWYDRTTVNKTAEAACEAAVAKESARYTANIFSLLQRVAPGLHTLSLVQWHAWQKLYGIECAGFPLLQELTLVGPHPFVPVKGCAHALYPRLARLHLVDNCGVFKDLLRLLEGAPRITHLRLTNLACIPAVLKTLVESEKRDKLPDLAQLLIQPRSPPTPSARCGNIYIEYWDFQECFQEFLAGAALPIEVCPHNASPFSERDRWTHSAKGDWLDRLEGGPGCWAVAGTQPRML